MKQFSHSLFCKMTDPNNPDWCDYCYNNAYLQSACINVDLKKTCTLEASKFDDTILFIPFTKQHWIYSLIYLNERYSVALYHRDIGSFQKKYQEAYNDSLKKANNLAIHFAEKDIEIIRKFSPRAVRSIIREINPTFTFTPEIGPKIPADTINKINGMLAYASEIGQEVPICFLFPGFTPKEIKYVSNDLKILEPPAVGIYAGNSVFDLLCKNVETIKDIYPDLPLFIVSITNPSKIRTLIQKGATNFCISGWGRIGSSLTALDLNSENWTEEFDSILSNCECDACKHYDLFKSDENLLGFNTAENLTIALHNVINFRKLIHKIKEEIEE